MAYLISNDCVMCGTCADECPVGAISEGDDKYVIDPRSLHRMWHLRRCMPLRSNIAALSICTKSGKKRLPPCGGNPFFMP